MIIGGRLFISKFCYKNAIIDGEENNDFYFLNSVRPQMFWFHQYTRMQTQPWLKPFTQRECFIIMKQSLKEMNVKAILSFLLTKRSSNPCTSHKPQFPELVQTKGLWRWCFFFFLFFCVVILFFKEKNLR